MTAEKRESAADATSSAASANAAELATDELERVAGGGPAAVGASLGRNASRAPATIGHELTHTVQQNPGKP